MSATTLSMPTNEIEEQARLDELYRLQVLDTPCEARFDGITQLAADIFDVKTVLVSLVDKDRQWFKSRVGLAVDETPRDASFCAHALPHQLLEVPDARRDPRFASNPLVTGPPHIRFYAGAVVHGPNGQPLGTLCLIDPKPRRLSANERQRLTRFARLVERELNQHTQFQTWAAEIQRAVLYHPVTAMPMEQLLEAELDQSLAEAAQSEQASAFVHLHVRNYDALTTLAGREGGNQVVQALVKRLKARVRPRDRVGHLGVDRIGVVMPGLGQRSNAAGRLQPLLDRLSEPVEVAGIGCPVQIAGGISRYPTDAKTADALFDRARTAATQAATGELRCYSRAGHAQVSRRHDQQYRLGAALQQHRLTQVYQPMVAGADGAIVGVEALARWYDEVYGEISPATFVPLAEAEPDLRRALTQWSLSAACCQLAAWRARGMTRLYISVNVPGEELYCPNFADRVATILQDHALAPASLVLEVTEESLITDMPRAIATLEALRSQGVRWAIDDFGTGYSSLNYLKQLPLDYLKIDRSFTRDIDRDATTRELTRGIVTIARTLGLSIVAEGVESAAQWQVLRALDCDQVQGFWFGRPERAETFFNTTTTATRQTALVRAVG